MSAPSWPAATTRTGAAALTVLSAGIASSVRGPGRTGLAHLGRSRGGAADIAALSAANRLVGNDERWAGVETSGGLVLRAAAPLLIACTGAAAELSVRGGPPLGWGVPGVLPAGSTLAIGAVHSGMRTYLAVRGGIVDADGPVPTGTTLVVGDDPRTPAATMPAVPRPVSTTVRLWPGPRQDWFTDASWQALWHTPLRVLATSDRRGVRLEGPELVRTRTGELPPEGLVEGAVQVPPDGRPIVMLADHPTTGGYPVIGVVEPADLGHVTQWAPGTMVRFVPGDARTTAH